MTNEHHFGRTVTRLRQDMGINQAELSRLVGTTKTAIRQYEERETADKCQFQHLNRLAEVFGVSIDYLGSGENPPKKIEPKQLAKAMKYVEAHYASLRDVELRAKLVAFCMLLIRQGHDLNGQKAVVSAFAAAFSSNLNSVESK